MSELDQILGCKLFSVLPRMAMKNLVYREKHDGVYVYFSLVANQRELQLQQYQKRGLHHQAISYETAIKILVLRIHNIDIGFNRFVEVLGEHQICISVPDLKMFFEYHGLEKKTTGMT